MGESVLSNIKVVLVQTTHPGNIGAAARAMKTMGLTRLCLVSPQGYPSAEATARASGADDVLHHAQVVADLEQAVAECTLVVGASARQRSIAWPTLQARECARELLQAAATAPVAMVFGREHSGLTNAELDRCQYLVRIVANPLYSSLNLAAAVQILAYELFVAQAAAAAEAPAGAAEPLASAQEMEGLFEHLEQVALQVGFLDPAQPRRLMRRLRRLLSRARPERTEVNILRGLLTALQRRTGSGE